MGTATFREGVGPLCSQSIFCSGLLPASTTCLLSDCKLAASPSSMRGPQSGCGCQLALATSHRTGAKDSAVLRVSLSVGKTSPTSPSARCPSAFQQWGRSPVPWLGPPSQPLQCNYSQLLWMPSMGVGWDEWGWHGLASKEASVLELCCTSLSTCSSLHCQNGPSCFAVVGGKSANPFSSRALQHGPKTKHTFILVS